MDLALLPLLLACSDDAPVRRTGVPDPGSTDPTAPTALGPGFSISRSVAVPFATAGSLPAPASLLIHEGDDTAGQPLTFTLEGDFALDGDLSPLSEGETRTWTVSYTGPFDAPILAAGVVQVSAGAEARTATLAAVLGDPDLPFPDWETDVWGTHAIAPFPSAPFPVGSDPWDDASVWISVPPSFSDPDRIPIATHLHGHNAVLAETVAAQRLAEQHALSGRDAIFVAPQGPYDYPSGDFGQLELPGGHLRLLRDVVSVLYRDGLLTRAALGAQVVSAHSGGYSATATILDQGGVPIDAAFLYDALYGNIDDYANYARDGGVLFSNWTDYGGTSSNNLVLADDLADLGPADEFRSDLLLTHDVAIGRSESAHGACMTDGLTHARWLAASPLPASPLAAPELLGAVVSGGSATITWRADRLPRAAPVILEGSSDGITWSPLIEASGLSATVPATAWVRLGPDGDRFAASTRDWLVVDGFDRVFGGSWSLPSHDFAARLGVALGGASTASNEAVAEGAVDLTAFDHVLWLLGDESVAEVTFDNDEQAAVLGYLDAGGHLIVSGSEVGYATDSEFLADLGVSYVSDDADTDRANGWTFGQVYPEDYPDVLAGDVVIWTYATGGAAAVRSGEVIAVGFPLETLDDDDLAVAVRELAAALGG